MKLTEVMFPILPPVATALLPKCCQPTKLRCPGPSAELQVGGAAAASKGHLGPAPGSQLLVNTLL